MDYSYLDQSHLDFILEIENESNPFPWTEGNFKDCLDKGYYSLALEDKNKFIGFAIMAISTDESHLLNIGINKNERGMGYGEKLLEVRLSNKTAYQLYKKLGFEEIGIRKKYYRLPEGREDAYVLSKSLKQDLISKFFFSSN